MHYVMYKFDCQECVYHCKEHCKDHHIDLLHVLKTNDASMTCLSCTPTDDTYISSLIFFLFLFCIYNIKILQCIHSRFHIIKGKGKFAISWNKKGNRNFKIWDFLKYWPTCSRPTYKPTRISCRGRLIKFKWRHAV